MAPKDGNGKRAYKALSVPTLPKDDPDDVFGGATIAKTTLAAGVATSAALASTSMTVAGNPSVSSQGCIAWVSSSSSSSSSAQFTLEERQYMASAFQLRHLLPITSLSTPAFLGLARRYLEFLLSPDTAEEARALLELVKIKEKRMGSARSLVLAPLPAHEGKDADGTPGDKVATKTVSGEQSVTGQKREPEEQESRRGRVRRRLANLEGEA